MTLPRVLLVDGDRHVLHVLSRLLGDSCELSLARDGNEALAWLESRRFDVVLAHFHVPGPGGLEILRAVKARTPDTEVILMAGDGELDRFAEAYALGAYECLGARFESESVARAVERAAERSALRAEVERLRHELGRAPVRLPGSRL